jgi:probable phosphoglycerate mutase
MFFTEPFYTSVSRVIALPGGYRQVMSLNETDHLR